MSSADGSVQRRPALESMLEDYWRLMPEYQNVKLEDLQPLRILFGFFPTYRQVAYSSRLNSTSCTSSGHLRCMSATATGEACS